MTGEDYIKAKVAEAGFLRGSVDGVVAMIAVMLVIRNQVNAGKNWIEEANSHIWRATEGLLPTWPDVRDPVFQQCLYAVEGIYSGTVVDKLTNEGLYIALGNTPEGFETCAKVGSFSIYK